MGLMGTIAQQFPARRQPDGRIWYRSEPFGWTDNPEMAHPSYFAPDAPPVIENDPARPDQPDMNAHAAGDLGVAAARFDHCDECPFEDDQACNPRTTECGHVQRALEVCPHGYPTADECGICRAKARADRNRSNCGPAAPQTPEPASPGTTTPDERNETAVTELAVDGTVAAEPRFTKTMGYPLPPENPRAKIVYDGWGRYKLPSPSTGRPTAYSRSTTVASTLDDTYNLNRWKIRTQVAAVLQALEAEQAAAERDQSGFDAPLDERTETLASLMAELRQKIADGNDNKTNNVIDQIDNLCGGRDAAELGEAVHAWLEAIDIGIVLPRDVPDMFKPYVTAYRSLLRRYGLIAVPEYVERIVLNDRGEETVAGTLDRIYYCVTDGKLYLGDVKTSKTLEFGYLTYGTQFAVYGYATKILAVDASGWEPMPEIDQTQCFCVLIPSDVPENAEIVTFDLWAGGEAMIAALAARRIRKEAKKTIPYRHAIPTPSKQALRYVEARQAIEDIADLSEAGAIREQYQDVWDDDLTRLGGVVAGLLNPA
ncbi:hypothetical protein SEA_GLENHOPE_50 [Mycobacterium phage GlenHope]|nr:hypothetical protein SEA_GLENHOPE_50 [Mycobacterium phage GlenHope]